MTKLATLSTIAILFSFTVSAQTSKGTVLLGGSVKFAHSKTVNEHDSAKSTTYSLSPNVSKFYKDNRLIGAGISYSRTTGGQSLNQYGLDVFLRQYLPIGKAFYLFANEGLYVDVFTNKYNSTVPIRKEKGVLAGLAFYPGIAYGVNKRLQLEIGLPNMATLYYNHSRIKDEGFPSNNSKTSNFGFSTGLSEFYFGTMSFGVRVVLNGGS
jgi:hypothetical protein